MLSINRATVRALTRGHGQPKPLRSRIQRKTRRPRTGGWK
jgi:hypothetical protein